MSVLGSRKAFHLPPHPGVGFLRVDGNLDVFKVALVSTTDRPDGVAGGLSAPKMSKRPLPEPELGTDSGATKASRDVALLAGAGAQPGERAPAVAALGPGR